MGKGLFKERLQKQHILIEKGVIYEVDRSALFIRISDERVSEEIDDFIASLNQQKNP